MANKCIFCKQQIFSLGKKNIGKDICGRCGGTAILAHGGMRIPCAHRCTECNGLIINIHNIYISCICASIKNLLLIRPTKKQIESKKISDENKISNKMKLTICGTPHQKKTSF
jgi:hypothetical protein